MYKIIFFLMMALPFLQGCGLIWGYTKIDEQHIVQSKDKNGEIAYYRITIDADARFSKSKYRAGLYDAEALDVLLVGVEDENKMFETPGQGSEKPVHWI